MKANVLALAVIAVIIMAAVAAASPAVNPNWRNLSSHNIDGASASLVYYSGGPDTLRLNVLADSAYGDSTIVTDWLQLGWGSNASTTLPPNYSLSDTIVASNFRFFDLWVFCDSLTLDWHDSLAIADVDGDSCNLASITIEFMIDDSLAATWADSSQMVVNADNYDHALYGVYRWLPPAAGSTPPGAWIVYSLRVPMCEAIRVRFNCAEDIYEISLISYRLVAKN